MVNTVIPMQLLGFYIESNDMNCSNAITQDGNRSYTLLKYLSHNKLIPYRKNTNYLALNDKYEAGTNNERF